MFFEHNRSSNYKVIIKFFLLIGNTFLLRTYNKSSFFFRVYLEIQADLGQIKI